MMKHLILFVLLINVSIRNAWAGDLTSIPFSIIDNRIVLKVPANNGETLNLIFDTGGQGLVLDSVVASNYGLIDAGSQKMPIPFAVSGMAEGRLFRRQTILKDSFLNKQYPDGNAINFNQQINVHGLIIHGILGMNQSMEKYIILLDMEDSLLRIIEAPLAIPSDHSVRAIDMIYTDKGQETEFSHFGRALPAGVLNIYIAGKGIVRLNGLFDTGCRYDYLLLTTAVPTSFAPADPTAAGWHTTYDSSRGVPIKLYQTHADSITISGVIKDNNPILKIKEVEQNVTATFGTAVTGAYIGMGYMKRFKKIYFNYPESRIYFME